LGLKAAVWLASTFGHPHQLAVEGSVSGSSRRSLLFNSRLSIRQGNLDTASAMVWKRGVRHRIEAHRATRSYPQWDKA
jgi:hypothetical protein